MALVALPGSPLVPIGPGWGALLLPPAAVTAAMDAANEAVIFIGQVLTSDEGSHTIDTTGSSSIGWRTGACTFANAGTTVKVGLAAVDTAAGPAPRAVNVANVITFDVSKTMVGGGGGIVTTSWHTHVPDSGSKTIAHGDLVALAIQMTARGGSDSVLVSYSSTEQAIIRPSVTHVISTPSYGAQNALPNAIITFSDGALGYFQGSDVFSTIATRAWNNTSGTKEYGQLYELPFPLKIYGLYGWMASLTSSNYELILYSDPLGTPVAEKTVSIDANTAGTTTIRKFVVSFATPYSTTGNEMIVASYKPTTSGNNQAVYRTLASAAHRVADPFGTSGYGVSRASGAFADANSSLDHYYIGLIAGAFNEEGSASIMGGSVIS